MWRVSSNPHDPANVLIKNLTGNRRTRRQSPNRCNSSGTDAFFSAAVMVCAIATEQQLVLMALQKLASAIFIA